MDWEIIVLPAAEKQLARISNPDKSRILTAIMTLEDGLEGRDIRPLAGRTDYWLRVGKWRVLMDIDKESQAIYINRIGPRGDVYK